MTQRESVRRTDVWLRAKYPHIKTRIFERDPRDHIIVVPQDQLDADQHKEEFEHSIRQAIDFVTLANSVPEGVSEIAPLADSELGASLSGLPLTVANLGMIVAGKFPLAPSIVSARPSAPDVMQIAFSQSLTAENETPVRVFLEQFFRDYTVIIVVQEPHISSTGNAVDILAFRSIRERPEVPEFVARDEQWWFENLEGLFSGAVPSTSFDITKDAGFSCYIHGTSFPNIDLRQALLAYDTIFLEPPFGDDRPEHAFWPSQDIGPSELLQLIEAGRLRLVHSQPEERSDLGFLREASEVNPAAVFSRRRLAGLVIADTVETADEYVLGRVALQEPLRAALAAMAIEFNQPVEELAKGLLYPSYLRRAALLPFLRRGAMGLAGLNQGSLFADAYKRQHGKEVLIEADMFGQAIHLAHVLNATYIPHVPHTNYVNSWLYPMQLFGDRLNFYRSFNTRIAASWAENERRKTEEHAVVLPPVPILKFDKRASVDHILEYTSLASDRRKARSLIGRLANLSEVERPAEIERLQQELYDFDIVHDRRERSVQWLDAGSGLAAYAVGLNLPPLFAGIFLLTRLLEAARKLPKMDGLIDAIESAISPSTRPNEDLHLLSKISRVATLRD